MEIVKVENVSKRYGRGARAVNALQEVSLSARSGEIYGLLGRNGAGKTTLVKLLLDLIRPTSGNVSVFEQSPRIPKVRRDIGYLPEDHRLPDYQTGEGVLHYYAMLSGVPADVCKKRVPQLLEDMKLTDAARRKIRTYSKGMKQRLALAQAMIHEPKLLFLDEPTDGVDPVGRAEIRVILEKLKADGKTIFLNSHLLSEVERVCDRVGILEKGRLICEGTIDELTRVGCIYTIQTLPTPSADIIEALKTMTVAVKLSDDELSVELEKDEDIDRIVDLLRARGFSIRAISGKRLSLEEVFLQAIENGKETAS